MSIGSSISYCSSIPNGGDNISSNIRYTTIPSIHSAIPVGSGVRPIWFPRCLAATSVSFSSISPSLIIIYIVLSAGLGRRPCRLNRGPILYVSGSSGSTAAAGSIRSLPGSAGGPRAGDATNICSSFGPSGAGCNGYSSGPPSRAIYSGTVFVGDAASRYCYACRVAPCISTLGDITTFVPALCVGTAYAPFTLPYSSSYVATG